MTIKNAIGFFDVTCKNCGKRFGWHGTISGRPPCPKCHGLRKDGAVVVVSVIENEKAFKKAKEIVWEYIHKLSESESLFIQNMFNNRREQTGFKYTYTQVKNINRIFKKVTGK